MAENRLEFRRSISAPASEVFRAFTRATPMRDWLCDAAMADARPGGRIYLWWNNGYYTAGEYTGLEPDRWVAFNLRGKGEPDVTQVEVQINAGGGGTHILLVHSGLGEGPAWSAIRDEFTKGWERGLENLQSLLETGQDLRFTRRPMLGITVAEFNPEIARSLGVPVAHGIRLGGVVEGLGAASAGLQQDDVLVSIAGKPTGSWPELVFALHGKRAGDTVEVVYFRRAREGRTSMTLSQRPLPDIPPTPAGLASAIRHSNVANIRALRAILRDMPDARAAAKPSPEEWSAMEVMAHLVVNERETQTWLSDMIADDERWSDGLENTTIVPARLAAILGLCPTAESMLDELKCALSETETIVQALPEKLVAHKGSYWRIGYSLLTIGDHWQEHLNQIETTVAAAPEK